MSTAISVVSAADVSPAVLDAAQSVATGASLRAKPGRVAFSREQIPESYEVVSAIQGNDIAIQGLLQGIIADASAAQFASSMLRPGYQADERLIIKRPQDRRVIAHVQAEPQQTYFGKTSLPVMRLRDLALMPEYEHRGLAYRLLGAAERRARQQGALLMVARGKYRDDLRKSGWTTLGSDPVSYASPQRLLGAIPQRREPEEVFQTSVAPTEELRIGRLTDLEAIQTLYEQEFGHEHGAVLRSQEYWSWLGTRRAHDCIYLFAEDEQPLGYVVVRGASVLELVDRTSDHRAAAKLLTQVGLDAIEQGRHSLKIHAPLSHVVHAWCELAGGQTCYGEQAVQSLVKTVSFRDLMRRLASELHRRHRLPHELSIQIGAEQLLLRPGARSIRVSRGVSDKHRLVTTPQAATRMLLGASSAAELVAGKLLLASSKTALQTAITMFPSLTIWTNCWDDVPVIN